MMIPALEMGKLTETLNWVNLAPSPEPIIPSFDHRGITFHFPKEKFENGRAIEYPIADDFYSDYCESNEKKHLVRLAATICRPESNDFKSIITRGDKRIPLLSREEAIHRAEILKDLPDEILLTVKLFFEGIKQYVHDTYGHWLFPQTNPEEENGSGGLNFGWWGMYQDVAENGLFGNLQQVYQSLFHDVAIYLIRKKEAYNQQLQKQNFAEANAEANAE